MAATKGQKRGFAAALALACAVAAPLTIKREGLPVNKKGDAVAYVDRIGRGKPTTICNGFTGLVLAPDGRLIEVKLGLTFPVSHCAKLLSAREYDDAKEIYRITPAIVDHVNVWGAMISFAHNFNTGVYRRSSMARLFAQGRWRDGCNALPMYNKGTVRGRLTVLPGLVSARERERKVCLS